MDFQNKLSDFRKELASIDEDLILLLQKRNKISTEIGVLKYNQKISIKQPEIWDAFSKSRNKLVRKYRLNKKFIHSIFKVIHKNSIKIQKDLVKQLKKG